MVYVNWLVRKSGEATVLYNGMQWRSATLFYGSSSYSVSGFWGLKIFVGNGLGRDN